ncbi:hypothetical protein [Dorea sp. ICN-14282]|uniref:hypothetical protein n=1 Tax=Dorea sp. ICN-14282 TaxID=3134654 RepID=UPI0030BB8E3B
MRQYHRIVKETQELYTIVCNCCGKRIPVIEGVPAEDVLEVEKRWGYASGKDNQVHRFELCEDCYDEMVRCFRVKPEGWS